MQSRLEEFTHLATSTATSKLMAFKLHVSAHNLFSQLWTHPTHRLVILAPEAHLPVSPADGFLGCELAAAHHLPGPEGWPWPHCLLMRVSPCAAWPLPLPPLQFGLHHSSDSAIVKVISHLCIPEFIGQFSTLLLLDISAFHKVDTHLLDTSSFIFQDAHTPSFISISLIFLLSFLS